MSAANSLDGIGVAQRLWEFFLVLAVTPLSFSDNKEVPRCYRRRIFRFCQIVRGRGSWGCRGCWPASVQGRGSDHWRDVSDGGALQFHVDLRQVQHITLELVDSLQSWGIIASLDRGRREIARILETGHCCAPLAEYMLTLIQDMM